MMYELIRFSLKGLTLTEYQFQTQRYLFDGAYCFPLTPKKDERGINKNEIANNDQMILILKALGE